MRRLRFVLPIVGMMPSETASTDKTAGQAPTASPPQSRSAVQTAGASSGLGAVTRQEPGVLRVNFTYADDQDVPKPVARAVASALVTDLVVGLVGKAAESAIDMLVQQTQSRVTTLEAMMSLPGFYGPNGVVAAADGVLRFHNGSLDDASDASLDCRLRLEMSEDASAFRFKVESWKCNRFVDTKTSWLLQRPGVRDFGVKIEFLSPSSAGLGTRAVFSEQLFVSLDEAALATAFRTGQELPWLLAPPRSAAQTAQRSVPLNVRVTVVETTKPTRFAGWFQGVAKDRKTDVTKLISESVRSALDPSFAASANMKLVEAGSTAYAAYKAAWDDLAAHIEKKPAEPPSGASEDDKAKQRAAVASWTASLTVKEQNLKSKRVIAAAAFGDAGLPWPGDMPNLKTP